MESRWRFHLFLTATSLSGLSYLFIFRKSSFHWISDWFRWCPTSYAMLEEAEGKMFSYLKKSHKLQFCTISSYDKSDGCKIRSLIMNENEKSTPLVLLHGFASGIGLWILNLNELSEHRPIYALDILGFGLSSRPSFSKDPELAESQLVDSIEEWRKQIGLNKFIILGHSMGGFLAASYSIKYPEHVKHLILADPWGFPTPDLQIKKIDVPLWVKIIAMMLRPFNLLAGLRAAGPWGPNLIKRLRPDILRKFEGAVDDLSDVSNYIYHCNAQYPSGEAAFKAMTAQFGWANRPMLDRISNLKPDISLTFIYGSRSWVDSSSGLQTKAIRKDSYVDIQIIQGAGHHVYADKAEEFNNIICNICRNVDIHNKLFIPLQNVEQDSMKLNTLLGNDEIHMSSSVPNAFQRL